MTEPKCEKCGQTLYEGTLHVCGLTVNVDDLYERMSVFVCAYGPKLLTRGMSALEANEAIMACLESLKKEQDSLLKQLTLCRNIIDKLPAYNVGQSFMSEEALKPLCEEYFNA